MVTVLVVGMGTTTTASIMTTMPTAENYFLLGCSLAASPRAPVVDTPPRTIMSLHPAAHTRTLMVDAELSVNHDDRGHTAWAPTLMLITI